MVSMLYRLGELSGLRVFDVMDDAGVREGTLRIHDIDWAGRNVPIKPEQFDWLPQARWMASDDFALIQIAVSKAEGRLIGFFDEEAIFQIVLFDPLHNAQPSKYNDYKVRLSKPLGCEVTALRHEVSQVMARSRERACGCESDLAARSELPALRVTGRSGPLIGLGQGGGVLVGPAPCEHPSAVTDDQRAA
jgi:hypothetical protein